MSFLHKFSKNQLGPLLFISTIIMISGCSSMFQSVDRKTFKLWGGTIFSSPAKVSMKQIHLDNGNLIGQKVIVEGSILEISKHGTYLTMSNDSARIMVVLTQLTYAKEELEKSKPAYLKIMGTVEAGKRGLPFIQAQSFNDSFPENKLAINESRTSEF